MLKAFQVSKWDWYRIGGGIFALWGAANTYVGATHYGWDQGIYWWFCNLALIGTAFGLLTKQRGLLLGFLSIACFTQVFWIADNLSRLFFGTNALGLVEFLYRPGIPVSEFLLVHYHYFTIPACILALYFLPHKKRSNSFLLISIFNPLIFGVSYFVFPKTQNINCIHEPCIPSLEYLGGPTYSILFWLGCMLAQLGIAYLLEGFFTRLKRTEKRRKNYVQAFVTVTVACIGLSIWDTQYKMSLPNLTCLPGTESPFARIDCDFTLEDSPGKLAFVYSVRNKTGEGLVCRTKAETQYTSFILDDRLALAPGENKRVSQVLPYPDVSVDVTLSTECASTGERAVASEPKDVPVRRHEAR